MQLTIHTAGKYFTDYLSIEEGKNLSLQATHEFPKQNSASIKVITLHEYEFLTGVILNKHLECDIAQYSLDEHGTFLNETLLQLDLGTFGMSNLKVIMKI